MLGKLFKYEFSATGRVFLPMYAALLVVSVIARVFYSLDLDSDIATALISMLMVMLFTAVWVVTLVIMIRRFSGNLLGREGYLMHVLPVDPWEHVLAKTVTSGVWLIAGTVVSTAAFLIMLSLPDILDIGIRELVDGMSDGIDWLRREGLFGQTVLLAAQLVLLAVISSFEFILSAYAAMCIGQLANTHRVWASIGAYFGLNMAQSFITSMLGKSGIFDVLVVGPSYGYPVDNLQTMVNANKSLAMFLLLAVAMCVALFFVSSILLKKKLNLQSPLLFLERKSKQKEL